ncbi:MAG: P1 family peptidase [Chloroflexota bacterium]
MAGGSIVDVAGLRVGHYTDAVGRTGCTVVLCPAAGPEATVGGVSVRGGSPGTRETDLLRPENRVNRVDAVLLTGGSAYGLDAAAGVMRFLESRGQGFPVGPPEARLVVPIVVGAVLFDLLQGDPRARPDAAAGLAACESASASSVAVGRVGAGTGATVGKGAGRDAAMPGGIGTASTRLADGTVVAALIAVNAYGDVVDPSSGRILAGARDPATGQFLGQGVYLDPPRAQPAALGGNTTIGVVATDAALSKADASWLATVAHDGLALAIRPCHTPYDGDTLFSLATGAHQSAMPLAALGAAAVDAVARAVVNAVSVS